MPKVSVIMSVYREPLEWIDASINSILNQSFDDFEYLIVNDNPGDKDLLNFLNEKASLDKRIVLITNEQNIGLTKSLNKGLVLARGKYIARMDADDVAKCDRFDKQVRCLERNDAAGLVHANYCIIDENGTEQEHFYLKENRISREWLVWTNTIAHSTVMFKSSLKSLRQPLYNELLRTSQDYDLWSFLSLNGVNFAFINEELLYYRVSSLQVSKLNGQGQKKNFYDIRRHYIISLLCKYGIIDEEKMFTAEEILTRILESNYFPNSIEQQKELDLILFRLYYTVAGEKKKYVWLYFKSKYRIHTRFSIRMNAYVLTQLIRKNFRPAYLF